MKIPNHQLRRYHYKIFFPENMKSATLDFIQQIDEIDITNHAAEQLLEDKRGIIPLPTKEEIFHPTNILVEYYEILSKNGLPSGKIQKLVLRVSHLSEKYDYTYVLAREGFIVSAWSNAKTDNHRMLNKFNSYYCPKNTQEKIYQDLSEKATNFIIEE